MTKPEGPEGTKAIQTAPEAFNFRNPDDWSQWRHRFQIATGLNQDSTKASQHLTTLPWRRGRRSAFLYEHYGGGEGGPLDSSRQAQWVL